MIVDNCWILSGLDEPGDFLLGKFKWGHSFKSLNEELFSLYAKCENSEQILAAQTKWLQDMETDAIARRQEMNGQ